MRCVLIGHPEHRRVAMFSAAMRARDPSCEIDVLSWRAFLDAPHALEPLLRAPCVLRIESPGEDDLVERQLLAWGLDDARNEHAPHITQHALDTLPIEQGRVLFPRQNQLGFQRALREIDTRVMHATARVVYINTPDSITTLGDKRLCHAHLERERVPVPQAFHNVVSFEDLVERMKQSGIERVFVKLACGSSASGVIAFSMARGRLQATTSLDALTTGFYNTLRVRRYVRADEIASIVNFVCGEGAHVEHWIARASVGALPTDVRVVTMGTQARHWVARLGRSPMTNLHLGNPRVPPARFLARMGEEGVQRILECAAQAARAFPHAHCIGADIALQPGFQRTTVLELNAFGDLIPNVLWQGQDTYTALANDLFEGRVKREGVNA